MIRDANFSRCGTRRRSLSRTWREGTRRALWIGVNPSKAGKDFDDPTVRKMIGFTERLGLGGFDLVNLFDYVATDVRELALFDLADDIDNDMEICSFIPYAPVVIAAWGAAAKIPKEYRVRALEVFSFFHVCELPVHSYGTTKDGSPCHPLMLAYSTPLAPFEMDLA